MGAIADHLVKVVVAAQDAAGELCGDTVPSAGLRVEIEVAGVPGEAQYNRLSGRSPYLLLDQERQIGDRRHRRRPATAEEKSGRRRIAKGQPFPKQARAPAQVL